MKHLESAFDGQNKGWKLPLTILTTFIGALIFAFPFGLIHLIAEMTTTKSTLEQIMSNNNTLIFTLLLSYVVLFFAFILSVRMLYNRKLPKIINGTQKIRWKRIGMGILVWGIIMIISISIGILIFPDDYTFQFKPTQFLILLALVILMMPFQTSAEELFFRGYLAQVVGGWTKNRWVVLLVTSVLFGALHYSNPEVKEYGALIMLPQYIITGVLFGLIAILDDGIELPLGIHFINNALGTLFVTFDASAIKSDALFKAININPQGALIETLITSALAFFILWRVYKWDFRILNKKITIPVAIEKVTTTEEAL